MKKIFSVMFMVAGLAVLAQAPKKFNYQAVVRDVAGNIIPTQAVGFDVAIKQGSASGTTVYEETQNAMTNSNGLVNLTIGTGSVVSGSMSSINWGSGPYFMEMNIDPTGGTSYTLTGTQELVSVPYALYAENSGTPGPAGVGIDSSYVKNDSLFLHYTNGNTMNAGYVKGNTGAQGVSITGMSINPNGTMDVGLSNSTTINAGTFPYKSFLTVPFASVYTSNTNSYTGIPIQFMIPPLYGPYTSISAALIVNYSTNNAATTGSIGVMDYGNYSGGAITPISGSTMVLPATNNVWVTQTAVSTFNITPGTCARFVFERTAGTGTLSVEAATLIIFYN